MSLWEEGLEFGTLTAAPMVAARFLPGGLFAVGLAGGAVSAYWTYQDTGDLWEAAEAGAVTGLTTALGGAAIGKWLPKAGGLFGSNGAKKEALEEAKGTAERALVTANKKLNNATNSLKEANGAKNKDAWLQRKTAAADHVADMDDALGEAVIQLGKYKPNYGANVASWLNGANVKPWLPYVGSALGANAGHYGRSYLRDPGYTGAVPTKIVATSKDGSFKPGMPALKVPDKRKIDEMIAAGEVPREWAVPPMLAAYMAGKPVA